MNIVTGLQIKDDSHVWKLYSKLGKDSLEELFPCHPFLQVRAMESQSHYWSYHRVQRSEIYSLKLQNILMERKKKKEGSHIHEYVWLCRKSRGKKGNQDLTPQCKSQSMDIVKKMNEDNK